jgi:FkbM family methyltransferase
MKNELIKLLRLLRLYSSVVIVLRPVYQLLPSERNRRRQQHAERLKRLRFYSQFIKKGDLCFDIGANLGNRTEIFRKLGATTIAVEPQDVCVASLKRRWRKDTRVKIIQKAVGAEEGEIEMQICTNCSLVSSCSREWIDTIRDRTNRPSSWSWDKTVTVQMTTLDNLIAEFGLPTFCKIDVEGFEYEVIKGLSHPIKALSLEATPDHLSPAVNSIRRLVGLGLTRFNYSVGESMEWALPQCVSADEIGDILENLSYKESYVDVYALTSLP